MRFSDILNRTDRVAMAPVSPGDRPSRWFVHGTLIATLLLQRFCLFLGGGAVYLCLFVFVAGLSWMSVSGRARLRRWPTALFGVFTIMALAATLLAASTPDSRINGMSLPSLLSVLALYAGLCLSPTEHFDGSRTFGAFVIYVRVCAVAGLLQYFAQYFGFRAFAFGDLVPALRPILVERLFNYHPIIRYGSDLMRSNGFFLLEPSTFSQLLMLAVIVEVFILHNWRWLPLYAVAYLYTYAGTGLLAFAIAAALAILIAPRSSPRLAMLLLAGAALAMIAAAVVPQVYGSIAGRANEVQYSGSSGYARYFGQVDILSAYAGETRTLIGYGPGALERADVGVSGSVNSALKLFFEYGLVGLVSFALFLIISLWRADAALLSLYVLVNYELGGGYLLFMPFVILSALLCIWSSPIDRSVVRSRVSPALGAG